MNNAPKLLLLALIILLAACAPAATATPATQPTEPVNLPKILVVYLEKSELPRYETLEMTVTLESRYENPYDAPPGAAGWRLYRARW